MYVRMGIPTNPGQYMTTGLICTKTCHENCKIADDEKKESVLVLKMINLKYVQENVFGKIIKIDLIN